MLNSCQVKPDQSIEKLTKDPIFFYFLCLQQCFAVRIGGSGLGPGVQRHHERVGEEQCPGRTWNWIQWTINHININIWVIG